MPVHHHVHHDARAVYVAYSGHLTPKTIVSFLDRFEDSLVGNPGFAELVDVSGVTSVEITADELADIFALIHGIYMRNAPRKVISLFATKTFARKRLQGFVDLLEQRGVGPCARLFDCRDAAVAALDIPLPQRHLFIRH